MLLKPLVYYGFVRSKDILYVLSDKVYVYSIISGDKIYSINLTAFSGSYDDSTIIIYKTVEKCPLTRARDLQI